MKWCWCFGSNKRKPTLSFRSISLSYSVTVICPFPIKIQLKAPAQGFCVMIRPSLCCWVVFSLLSGFLFSLLPQQAGPQLFAPLSCGSSSHLSDPQCCCSIQWSWLPALPPVVPNPSNPVSSPGQEPTPTPELGFPDQEPLDGCRESRVFPPRPHLPDREEENSVHYWISLCQSSGNC